MKLKIKSFRRVYLYSSGSVFHNFDEESKESLDHAFFEMEDDDTGALTYGFLNPFREVYPYECIKEVPIPYKKL